MVRVNFLPLLAVILTVAAEAATDQPLLHIKVEREERAKVIGLAQQLETVCPTGGALHIGNSESGGNPDDWQIAFRWDQSPKEKEPSADGEKTKPDPWPRVSASATDAEKVRATLLEAAGDSFGGEPGADWQIATLAGTKHAVEIVFPGPQTGISKARQFRVARRFVSLLMRELGMRTSDEKTFRAGIFEGRVLGNYDAEGVGYGGSTLLDRAVDETSLEARLLPMCPEDIREGALAGAAGVMFPGGSGKAIAKALRPEGVEKVRKFVAAGGGYYGVCAGAYFANSGLPEYAALLPLKHHQPWRKGKGMLKVALTEEGKKLLGNEFAEFETRYNCGPVFTESSANSPEKQVTVLANFASAVSDKEGTLHSEMVGTPAILSGRWGKGRVITVSPHPESHTELSPLVARAIALSLGLDSASIRNKDGAKQTRPEY